jgi:hypothetical protein
LKEGNVLKKSLFISVMFVLITVLPAFALTFEFSDSAVVPVSAVMDISISGNSIHVELNNTSPIKYNGLNNFPAIIGFGFRFANYGSLLPISWTIEAKNTIGTLMVIGQSDVAGDWMKGSYDNNNIFMLTNRGSIGGLYNPLADVSSAASPAYLTTTYLDMTFAAIPILNEAVNPYIKIIAPGSNNFYYVEGRSIPTPEPGTLLLMGIGLIGIALVMREML